MEEKELELFSINEDLLRTNEESYEQWEWDYETRSYTRTDEGDEL